MAIPAPSFLDPTLDIDLKEIGQVDLLTAQEEKDLARRVAEGSREAFETLVLANLRFVVFVAKRYRRRGLPLMDLIAEGNVGLLEAVVRFDPDAGCRFTTYAYWRIMKCINAALRGRTRVVHVPAQMVDRMRGWAKAADAVWDKLAESVPDARTRTPAEEVQHREELDALRGLLEELDPRDQRVLEMRFGMGDDEPMTLRAVGAELQMTHEAARHIERRALARLRDALRTRRHGAFGAAAVPA